MLPGIVLHRRTKLQQGTGEIGIPFIIDNPLTLMPKSMGMTYKPTPAARSRRSFWMNE
jgi:hypothetical protein